MLVFKNLLRRKVRTVLSIVGIAVGIAVMVAIISVVEGYQGKLVEYAKNSGAQLIVSGSREIFDIIQSRISKQDVESIRSMEGVDDIASSFFYIVRKSLFPLLIFGRNPEEPFVKRYQEAMVRGHPIQKDDEIMLGYLAAESLKKNVGDEVELLREKFKVVGIYRTSVIWENVGCIIAGRVIQKAWKMGDSVNLCFIYLKDASRWKEIKEALQARFPQFVVVRPEEFTQFFENQFQYFGWLTWLLSLIVMVAGGIAVLNTMLMNISERFREMGILKAMGWNRVMLFRMIFWEGLMLSFCGGIVGVLGGVGATQLLIRLYPQSFLVAEYHPSLLLQAMGVAVGLGILGSLYPAHLASRLSVVEALKYE